ncbi:MAG: hypothetical protein GY757_48760, partial [bacterium]|nr:hypothetical protein [bacterium]
NLQTGLLMKLGLFHLQDGDRLLMVIHHLVIDTISWHILLEDMEDLLRQYRKGETLRLPLKSDSFKRWTLELYNLADSSVFLEEQEYWRRLEMTPVPTLQKDFPEESNYVENTREISVRLSEDETQRLLTRVNRPFATEINDILITALAMGIKDSFALETEIIPIAMEGHGREEILENVDISRTVGWFTSMYPVLLDIFYKGDLSRQLREVKETLRRLPQKGIGYGMLKYITSAALKKEMKFKLQPTVAFNYLGQLDVEAGGKTFRIADESPGNPLGPKQKRPYELDISGQVTENQLTISLFYNTKQYKEKTAAALMENFREHLTRIIVFCSGLKEKILTPSDLTHSKLTIQQVDRLTAQYPLEDVYTLAP